MISVSGASRLHIFCVLVGFFTDGLISGPKAFIRSPTSLHTALFMVETIMQTSHKSSNYNHRSRYTVAAEEMAPVLDRGELSRVLYISNKQSKRNEAGVDLNREYRQYRLLTADEEVIMGKICSTGKQIRVIRGKLNERLNRSPTEAELADACEITMPRLARYRSLAFSARNRLVQHNTGLVDFWLRGILERSTVAKDISYFELVAEGLLGLIKAAENYDGRARFGTYSQPYIRDFVYRGISKLKSGAVSSHRSNMLANRIKKMEYEYRATLGRAPTPEEIAAALHTGLAGVESVREDAKRRLTSAFSVPDSWSPMRTDGAFAETVESYFDLFLLKEQQPDFSLDSMSWRIDFNAALICLSPIERRALGLRYGYIDGEIRTMKETSTLLDMTEEGLRKLIRRSFEKLRKCGTLWKDGPDEASIETTPGRVSANIY